jgi:excisionase family DNA binding protein
MTQTEVLLTVPEVAELLGVNRSWVQRAVKRGEIPNLRLGRYIRFRRESVDAWIKEREQNV